MELGQAVQVYRSNFTYTNLLYVHKGYKDDALSPSELMRKSFLDISMYREGGYFRGSLDTPSVTNAVTGEH